MRESIKQLLSVQERDLELDRWRAERAVIPAEIAALKRAMEEARQVLENSKKELTRLQLVRKEREVDLESKETAIRKHSTDLNAVKSNDAYRALMGEIEKVKEEKSALEDEILQLLEQIDQAQRAWKQSEASVKTEENGRLHQISELEAKEKSLERQIAQKENERNDLAAGFSKGLLDRYDQLRKGKRGTAVVPLKNEQCSGCHMRVSQNLINEVRRGQSLIACETCSRIVYLEDVLVL